jgi:hypothetical protein
MFLGHPWNSGVQSQIAARFVSHVNLPPPHQVERRVRPPTPKKQSLTENHKLASDPGNLE